MVFSDASLMRTLISVTWLFRSYPGSRAIGVAFTLAVGHLPTAFIARTSKVYSDPIV